jgi:hypothetical protein
MENRQKNHMDRLRNGRTRTSLSRSTLKTHQSTDGQTETSSLLCVSYWCILGEMSGPFRKMKMVQITLSVLALCHSTTLAAEDWRLEFLKASERKTDTDSLRKIYEIHHKSPEELKQTVALLGADTVSVRNAAQQEILRMGKDVLPILQEMPPPQDAEARLRFRMIEDRLTFHDAWDSQQLVRVAAAGLLYERENPGKHHPSRQMFVEFFRQPSDSLRKGYRRMRLLSTENLDGSVAEETLRLTGKRLRGEADQRLSVSAQEATGTKQFPGRFRISVKIGGMAGGEGTYHVGVSVGKVRALFHPGLEEGAFRFEKIDTGKELTSNEDMGFTPEIGGFVDMKIDVQRHVTGKVTLAVEVSDKDIVYRAKKVFDADQIGALDQVSLDRSGHHGGDGLFRNLVLQFALP